MSNDSLNHCSIVQRKRLMVLRQTAAVRSQRTLVALPGSTQNATVLRNSWTVVQKLRKVNPGRRRKTF